MLPSCSTSCFGAGQTSYNGTITLFGGYSGGELTSVRSYNPSNGAEVNLGSISPGAGRFQWGRIGTILYITSGSNSSFRYYDLSTNTGSTLTNAPIYAASYASQLTECDGRIFVTDFRSQLYAYIP